MVSSELSDKKPGIVTAFRVLVALLVAGVIVVIILFLSRGENTYDTERAAKRYENLKKLNEDNAKKAKEFAILDKDKGIYQLPIDTAIALTAKDLATIAPHSAYPVATPAPAPVAAPSPAAAAPAAAPSPAAPPAAKP